MVLMLTKCLISSFQTGVDIMGGMSSKFILFTSITETFWAIGCSVVANALPA